jgi:hypothetical protein
VHSAIRAPRFSEAVAVILPAVGLKRRPPTMLARRQRYERLVVKPAEGQPEEQKPDER